MDPTRRTSPEGMRKINKIIKLQMQYPRWLRTTVKKILDEEILKKIHQRMKDFGYSEKIIKGTKIHKIVMNDDGSLDYEVESKLMREKYDVAKGREEGTIDHKIEPLKEGGTLSWIVGGFIRGFSKGHWVKGITKSNIIEKTMEEFEPKAQARLDVETDRFVSEKLG